MAVQHKIVSVVATVDFMFDDGRPSVSKQFRAETLSDELMRQVNEEIKGFDEAAVEPKSKRKT